MKQSANNVLPHVASVLQRHSQGADRTLEIGCGGAQYKPYIPGKYVGADLQDIRYSGDGPDVFADAQHLPFKQTTFDFIFLVGVLHIVPDIELALSEAHRVLNPGGRLLVFDYNFLGTRRLAKLNQRKLGRATEVWSPWGLARSLQKAGFSAKVEWDYVRGNSRPARVLQRFKIIRFLRFWLWQFAKDWSIVSGKKRAGYERGMVE